MQSLETSFFLIALGRFPHALVACATAIESAIQTAGIGDKRKDGLTNLINKAKTKSPSINNFDGDLLIKFTRTRNDIVHRGYVPQDNARSAKFYLTVALPLLSICYQDFHSFNLTETLLKEYSKHIEIAQAVLEKATRMNWPDPTYCLDSFSHGLRLAFKQNFSANWENRAFELADTVGARFEAMNARKEALESYFKTPWTCNCPVCDDVDCVIADLDADKFDDHQIVAKGMECTNCGFSATDKTHPFLSHALLEPQLSRFSSQILREHGVL